MNALGTSNPTSDNSSLHTRFLAIVPRIQLHAQIYFRDVKCPHQREDCIAEAVALAWKWFRRLVEKGKDPSAFPSAIATFAARAVRSGRRLVGMEKPKDVLSPVAQRRGFSVSPLPNTSSLNGNVFGEALQENTVSPIPDQVAFRLDFPSWRCSRCDRDQRLIDALILGERTLDVARKHGLSPARVSQLRHEFHDDWLAFCGTCPQFGEVP